MIQERFPGLQTFLGATTLLCVLVSAIALGANRPVSWSLLSLAVMALFGFQLLLGSFNGVPIQARTMWLPALLYILVLGWGAIQLIPGMGIFAHPVWTNVVGDTGRIGADPGQGQHVLMRLIAYGMIFWIALRTAVVDLRAAWMLRAIAIFSTGIAVFGIWSFFTGHNAIVDAELTRENDVVQGTFVNRNNYATYAIFGALANIAVALDLSGVRPRSRDLRKRIRDALELFFGGAWIYGIGALLCIGAASLTQSRAGGLAGIIGLVVLLASWRGRGRRLDPILIGTLAAILIFVALTSATGLAERLLATDDEAGRFFVYPAVVSGISERPLLGHGIGSFWDAFRVYLPQKAAVGEWVRAHNTYLENIFEMGIPAAAMLYLALGIITYRIWQGAVRRRSDRAFTCFALSAIAAGGFHSFFDFSLQMPATAALFAVILGIGVGQAFPRDELKRMVLNSNQS